MAILKIPGTAAGSGDFFVETRTGEVWRLGREGGTRHPVTGARGTGSVSDLPAGGGREQAQRLVDDDAAARADIERFFSSASEGSSAADEALQVQVDILKKQWAWQEKLFKQQEQAELEFEKIVGSKRSTWEATRAKNYGEVEALQLDRLKKALKGELPVDPATERALQRNEALEAEGVARDLGSTGQNSSAGIARLAHAKESSEIVRSAERRGEISGSIPGLIGVGQNFDRISYQAGDRASGMPTFGQAGSMIEQDRANRALLANLGLNLLGQYNAQSEGGNMAYLNGVRQLRGQESFDWGWKSILGLGLQTGAAAASAYYMGNPQIGWNAAGALNNTWGGGNPYTAGGGGVGFGSSGMGI